ncbi:MAG: hypothetical protein U5K69_18775 [Balneolaceae bacterium]|nr:hypothetical protein [Balneolaceae bacterium]
MKLSTQRLFQFGRKEIFYQEYREELRHAENIKVYLNATALELRTDEYANRIRSIAATTLGGRQFDVRSQCFILAMGGLENPRLLLLSNNQIKPGIGNQHDRVGRFFMEHPHLWSGVFYPSTDSFFSESGLYNIHYRDNLPVMGKLVLSEEKMREEKILNNTVSIHFSPMQALRKPVRAIYEVKQSILRGKADESILSNLKTIFSNPDVVFNQAVKKISGTDWLANHGKKFKYSGYLLNMMSEQAPDPESRVSLSRNRDRFGQNRLELNWKMNGSDVRSIRRFQEILDGELRKNLLGHLDIELEGDTIPEKIHGGYHHMGTTRMDRDPKKEWLMKIAKCTVSKICLLPAPRYFRPQVMQIPH